MAGHMSRLGYDQGAYQERVQRSMAPGTYRVNPAFLPKAPGFPEESAAERIDVDSLLRGLDQYRSRDSAKAIPRKISVRPSQGYREKGRFDSDMTRMSNPAFNFKTFSTEDYHYDFPLRDPQAVIHDHFGTINTRQQARDEHRAVWQEPMDQSAFFPKPRGKGRK